MLVGAKASHPHYRSGVLINKLLNEKVLQEKVQKLLHANLRRTRNKDQVTFGLERKRLIPATIISSIASAISDPGYDARGNTVDIPCAAIWWLCL